MRKTTSRVARLGLVWAAVTVASLVAAPSANAATFNSSAPTKATDVTTVRSENTGHGTLQLRKGKYDGKTYLWARISSPDSTLNSGWDLKFSISSSSMPGAPTNCRATDTGSTQKDIDTTTYTSAAVVKSSCHYHAIAVERNGGGYHSTDRYSP